MNKDHFLKFFRLLKRPFKNPLWVIVILLLIMNFLLWGISQRIGYDRYLKKEYIIFGTESNKGPTGIYSAIYRAVNNIDIYYYDKELKEIIERIEWIDSKLDDIEWNTRW